MLSNWLLTLTTTIHIWQLYTVNGLTQVERDELSKKFKYYHSSVRPTAPENIVTSQNGTYFTIELQIHLLFTSLRTKEILAELVLISSFIDDRLTVRELQERVELPDEFKTWSPRLTIIPLPFAVTRTLSPVTGEVNTYYKIRDLVSCTAEEWKYPFEKFTCELIIVCEPDSVLTISQFRDFRSETQQFLAGAKTGAYPSTSLFFEFVSEWPPSVMTAFLPSVLIVAIVFQAQWKRRKVQVLISVTAVVATLIMIASHHIYSTATLMDLWLFVNFLTVIGLLIVDVTLPARRVRYTLLVHIPDSSQATHFVPPPFETVISQEEGTPSGTWGKLNKFAQKALLRLNDEARTKTELVDTQPGEVVATINLSMIKPIQIPMQRHVTTAQLGKRKKIALLIIASAYIIFLFLYITIVMTLE